MRAYTLLTGLLLLSHAWGQAETDREKVLEREVLRQKRLLMDWGGLLHYGSDNTELQPPAPGENRVVFLGDQTTEAWGTAGAPFFAKLPYLNRGIAGQTTGQMLVRFRQDVIELQPKVVVILAGLNDIAGANGPATREVIAENLMSMADLAKAHGIGVVIASVLPVCDCFVKSDARQRWRRRIVDLNDEMKDFAAKNGAVYLDYHSVLADNGLTMKKELTIDGIIPDDAGFNAMSPLAERAIALSLSGKVLNAK